MKLRIVSAVCWGLLFCGIAGAADLVTPMAPEARTIETKSGWTFSIAPYFWAAGLSGDVAQFGLPSAHVDASFSDIFKNLDFAAMGIGEARYDRFSLFTDVLYTKISVGKATPVGLLATGVGVTTETFAQTIGAGYTVLRDQSSDLDVFGGVRIWNVASKLSFNGGFLDGVSSSDSATWVDGVVGLRGNYFMTPHVYLTAWGLVGAGGADVDWDVAGALGYKFNEHISAVAGYRALGVDYSNNQGFVFNVVQQGPIAGLVVHF